MLFQRFERYQRFARERPCLDISGIRREGGDPAAGILLEIELGKLNDWAGAKDDNVLQVGNFLVRLVPDGRLRQTRCGSLYF
jgi:hypothetical protein